MSRVEKITLYLPHALKHALEQAAQVEGRSQSDLVREGINRVTGRNQVAEPRLPLFKSGRPDLAARSDELLEGFGEQ
jgi:hypothetical protein